MKICFLAPASIHAARWADFFAAQGHEVHLLIVGPGTDLPSDDVFLHDLRREVTHRVPVLDAVALARPVLRLIRELQPDIVHGHSIGVPGILAALTGHSNLVLTAWGSDVVLARPWTLRRLAVRWALSQARLVTCDAEHMRRKLLDLGASVENVEVVFFGTDVSVFRPGVVDPIVKRQMPTGEGPRVVSTRSLQPIYDVETLVRAVPAVIQSIPDCRFIIGGDGPERRRLEDLVEELGMSRAVIFLGSLSQSEIVTLFNVADVYVSTSLSDGGLAGSTAEAMACGRAVIVTDSADNREWITEDINGYLFACSAYQTLSARLVQLLNDSASRERVGAEARRTIVERNNYHVQMAKIEAMYAQLLRAGSHAPLHDSSFQTSLAPPARKLSDIPGRATRDSEDHTRT